MPESEKPGLFQQSLISARPSSDCADTLECLTKSFLVILSEAKNLNVTLRFFVAPLLSEASESDLVPCKESDRMTSIEISLEALRKGTA